MSEDAVTLVSLDWPAPDSVKALITTRNGGLSSSPYMSANFADHVGDDLESVMGNRDRLARQVALGHWQWLEQVHSSRALRAHLSCCDQTYPADASYTRDIKLACAVLSADCLPILLCDINGTEVAAVHAGWRGLASGIVQQTLGHFSSPKRELMAYLGPAISQQHFEVGGDVLLAFKGALGFQAEKCFIPSTVNEGHYFADLYALATVVFNVAGIDQVFGGGLCTFSDDERFYSYRRDKQTGRMVSAIWLDENSDSRF